MLIGLTYEKGEFEYGHADIQRDRVDRQTYDMPACGVITSIHI